MRIKTILLWLCTIALLIGHFAYKYNTDGVWYGMDRGDVEKIHPNSLRSDDNAYFMNHAGNFVVVEYASNRVERIHVIDASFANPTNFRMGRISEGMSVTQVVALVGLPLRLTYAGVSRTLYVTNDYTNYGVHWKTDYVNKETFGDTAVKSVDKNVDERITAEWMAKNKDISSDIKFFPMLQLVPWLHNLLDGAIVWAAILYTAKLRNQQKKKTAETE